MASKRTIKRIVLATVWTAIAGGVITLLVAANGKEQKHTCSDVLISIQGMGERYFISKGDIAKIIRPEGEPTFRGRATDQIDLSQLEQKLERNAWIQDAELYFDRNNAMHVLVVERQPIARVFTTNGSSFYIDSAGARLPLLPHISARVPVITNYPSARKPLSKDSTVLQDVRHIVKYISSHDFWSAQIAQVDITPVGKFELLPTVGNHIIRLGSHEKLEEKLDKLMLLYRQVLSKTGFDKYSVLDIQFAGQVVAVHRGEDTSVDSVQLKKNIAALLRSDQLMKGHTSAETPEPDRGTSEPAPAPVEKPAATVKPEAEKPAALKPKPAAENNAKVEKLAERKKEPPKQTEEKKTEKKNTRPAPSQQKPKAVMPKKSG